MVGIIILNYNSAEDTIKCIASIEKFTKISYKIYIVEGASKDNSFNILSDFFSGNNKIKIIQTKYNGGYSYGNNLGVKMAIKDGADLLLIINPDVILLNNAVDIMYDEISCQNEVVVVGPRIFDPYNKDMQFAMKLLTFTNFIFQRKPFSFLKNKYFRKMRFYNYEDDKIFNFKGMVSGCCFMIKSDTFNDISLFDENIFLYFEEDVISYKLDELNKLTTINPNAKIMHNHSATVSKEGEAFVRFHRFFSSEYVLKKYAGVNNVKLLVVSCFHILPFAYNSIFNVNYRKYFMEFIRKILSVYKIKNN